MSKIDILLIRHAIELIAVIGDHSETMLNLTKSFIKSEFDLNPSTEEIRKSLDRETSSRLFFACAKNKPEEIKNPGSCIRISKDLWFNYQIATTDSSLSEYRKLVQEKFELEKKATKSSDLGKNYLERIIDDFEDNDALFETYKEYITKTVQYFQVAFYVLDEYFSKTNVNDIFTIYNPFKVEKKTESVVEQSNDKKDSKVKYLEKTIHELKIKLDFAQKDSIREIMMSLASSCFGSPIFTLNEIKNEESTPEHIKSAISNLFLALESLDIRISKEGLVGTEYKAEEIEEGKFSVLGNEQISPDDTVIIKYPGIKLGREMIIKPALKKGEK